jgi:hypothetical protein
MAPFFVEPLNPFSANYGKPLKEFPVKVPLCRELSEYLTNRLPVTIYSSKTVAKSSEYIASE